MKHKIPPYMIPQEKDTAPYTPLYKEDITKDLEDYIINEDELRNNGFQIIEVSLLDDCVTIEEEKE